MNKDSQKEQQNDGNGSSRFKTRGAIIMKTVSILLVNSRKVSNQRKEKAAILNTGKTKKNGNKMDDGMGKLTPKLLEMLKKKTHFSK